MTVPVNTLFTPATAAQWQSTLLGILQTLGVTTTAWQPGGITRTMLAMISNALAGADQIVSWMAQGGFLQTASAITTDPSTNPGAAPGWLDAVGQGRYNLVRFPATYASNSITITNASASVYGPFAPGTYHIANPSTGATYSNTASLTIGGSGTTTGTFSADVAGAGGSSAPGTITQTITSLVGVTVSNSAAFVGSNAESNSAYVQRCLLKLQSLSPNGPIGAYQYFALSAASILAAQTPPATLVGGPITRAGVAMNPLNGLVSTTVANASGIVTGTSLLITGATNAQPIQITTATAHGLLTGASVTIQGVVGNTAANGTWIITVTGGSTFTLNNSTGIGFGAYTSGGTVYTGDLGLVDGVIQANCVPDAVTAVTQSATATPITIVVNVWVPANQQLAVPGIVQTALTNYFATLPIGGLNESTPNSVPFDAVLGVVFGSAPYIHQATLTLNGGTSDITLGLTSVATINGTPTVNVNIG